MNTMFQLGKAIDTRTMISYCGQYCRECPAYTKEISILASELRNELDSHKSSKLKHKLSHLDKSIDELGNYNHFYDVLKDLEKLNCGLVCKKGGGSIDCSIKNCCENMKIEGCWECKSLESCDKLDDANPNCGKNNLVNLLQIRDHGIEKFLGIKES